MFTCSAQVRSAGRCHLTAKRYLTQCAYCPIKHPSKSSFIHIHKLLYISAWGFTVRWKRNLAGKTAIYPLLGTKMNKTHKKQFIIPVHWCPSLPWWNYLLQFLNEVMKMNLGFNRALLVRRYAWSVVSRRILASALWCQNKSLLILVPL